VKVLQQNGVKLLEEEAAVAAANKPSNSNSNG
jgi:hypothetical protein